MAEDLTKKQKDFITEYLETGNGTQAALKAYDTTNPRVAAAIASENLTKPNVKNAIEEALPDVDLAQAHRELLNQTRTDYFTFPKKMTDEEIEEKVRTAGLELIVIQFGEKGKYAFYSTIDPAARSKALDMAYRLKGSYAAEKSINLNIDAEIVNPEAKKLAEEYERKLKEQL